MKLSEDGRSPPNRWDLLESWLDKLTSKEFWKKFKARGKNFLVGVFVTIVIFVFLALSFLPIRITKGAALNIPGIHEAYEWLFLNKTEKTLAEGVRRQLGYFGGNMTLSFIYSLDSVKTEKERKKIIDSVNFSEPQIIGFEIINIPDEELANVLRNTIPKGYLHNVKKIIYKDRESVNPAVIYYGFSFKPASSANPLTKNITVFYQWKTVQIKAIRKLLAHEISHLNDWNSNVLLTREERLKLFCDILGRLGAGDEYSSCYVESINPKNKFLKKYMRAIEYWAEINKEYLGSTEKTPDLSPKDQELIENVLQKMDPDFWQKANNWRCQSH